MPPVLVPAIRSKWSAMRQHRRRSMSARKDAENAPKMPPPSRDKMRNRPPGSSVPSAPRMSVVSGLAGGAERLDYLWLQPAAKPLAGGVPQFVVVQPERN